MRQLITHLKVDAKVVNKCSSNPQLPDKNKEPFLEEKNTLPLVILDTQAQ